jgi:hypothetical protein
MEATVAAEWIRVDDGQGERWHRLVARVPQGIRLETACGLKVQVEATMDRRPEAPKRSRCKDCLAAPVAADKPKTDMSAAGDDGQVFGG